VDETGDLKRGRRIVLAAQQEMGMLGQVANGVVAVTRHWADGARHAPLGVKPYQPASRLPTGRKDPAFQTKPQVAWQLVEEARGRKPLPAGGRRLHLWESADLEAKLFAAQIPYVMGLRPWAWLQLYWRRWSSTAPPPELAALLAHVARSRPLEAYT
jgi:hypothetical protein